MSDANTLNEFKNLLSCLLHEDNAIRHNAEATFKSISLDQKFVLLLHSLSVAASDSECLIIVLSLRSLIVTNRGSLLSMLQPSTVEAAQTTLLSFVAASITSGSPGAFAPTQSVLKKIITTLAAFAKCFITRADNGFSQNSWSAIIEFIGNCLSSDNTTAKKAALLIIYECPDIFGNSLPQIMPQLLTLLFNCFNAAGTQPEIAVHAIDAISAIAEECDTYKKCRPQLVNIAPTILQSMNMLLGFKQTNMVVAQDAITSFNVLVESHSWIFKNNAESFFELIFAFLSQPDSEFQDDTFNNELYEVLLGFIEHSPRLLSGKSKKNAQQTNGPNKYEKYIVKTIQHAFLLLFAITDQQVNDWLSNYDVDDVNENNTGNDDDDDSDMMNSLSVFGETSMDRISLALKGSLVFPIVMQFINDLFNSNAQNSFYGFNVGPDNSWQHIHAAIVTIGAIAEGCTRQLKPKLEEIVPQLVPFLKHANPKVAYAAINTLGQIATDFRGTFHKKFHGIFFPAIFDMACNGNPHIQVQCQAIYSFINIIEGLHGEMVELYVPQMAERINFLLSNSLSFLTGVACIDDNTKKVLLVVDAACFALISLAANHGVNNKMLILHFMPICFNILQVLFNFFINNTDNVINNRKVKLSIISKIKSMLKCIVQIITTSSLDENDVAGAGKKINEVDNYIEPMLQAMNMFHQLIQSQQTQKDDYDQLELSYLTIMSKLTSLADERFSSVLPMLVPTVLKYIQLQYTNEQMSSDEVYSIVSSTNEADKTTAFKTDSYQDAVIAIDLISNLCKNLKNSFVPYLDKVFEVLIPILSDNTKKTESLLKTSLTQCYSDLLECCKLKSLDDLSNVWQVFKNSLIHLITNLDTDEYTLSEYFDNLSSCALIMQEQTFSNHNEIAGFCSILKEHLNKLVKSEELRSGVTGDANKQQQQQNQDENDSDEYNDEDVDMENMEALVADSIRDLIGDLYKIYKHDFDVGLQVIYMDILHIVRQNPVENPKYSGAHLINFAFSVISDLISYSPNLFKQIHTDFMADVIQNLHNEEPDVCQSCAYAVGLVAQIGDAGYNQYVQQSLQIIFEWLTDSKSLEYENLYARANFVSALGRIIRYGRQTNLINDMGLFQKVLCLWLRNLPAEEDETEFNLTLLNELIGNEWEVIMQVLQSVQQTDLVSCPLAEDAVVVLSLEHVLYSFMMLCSETEEKVAAGCLATLFALRESYGEAFAAAYEKLHASNKAQLEYLSK